MKLVAAKVQHVNALTNDQVRIALTFMSRAELDRDYRLLGMSSRYQRMLDLVRASIDDPLIAGDIGIIDMLAVTAYFVAKRDEAMTREESLS